MPNSDIESCKAQILSAFSEALDMKIEKGELTEDDMCIIAQRSRELSEDLIISAMWLKDPEHPQNVGRTMRRLVGAID